MKETVSRRDINTYLLTGATALTLASLGGLFYRVVSRSEEREMRILYTNSAENPEPVSNQGAVTSELKTDSNGYAYQRFIDSYDSHLSQEVNERVVNILTNIGRAKWFNEAVSRVSKFKQFIDQYRGSIPYHLAVSWIVQESGGNPKAKHPNTGAAGLTQLMEETAMLLGIKSRERFNPEISIRGGLTYLRTFVEPWFPVPDGLNSNTTRNVRESILNSRNTIVLGLSTYNWGPGMLERNILNRGLGDSSWERLKKHLPEETRNYVPEILSRKFILDDGKV